MSSRRPDLVFLHPSDEIYGADRMLLEMLAAVPAGQDVEVWVPTDLEHPVHPLCAVLIDRGHLVRHVDLPIMRRAYLSPRGAIGLIRRAGGLFRLLRRHRPAVVYCTTSAAFLGAPIARAARTPRVIGHVQEIWSDTDRRVLSPSARACHQILAISEPVRSALPRGLQVRTSVVENSTPEPDAWSPVDEGHSELVFLVASRWNRWKGHGTLLDGWDLAGCPGRLIVLGAAPLSGDGVDVPKLVSALSDPSSVEIVGEVPDVSSYLNAADVIVMPSDEPEPFGLIAIEAFARARPVIASDGGGLAGIVTDGATGWLFPPRDVHALARTLAALTRTQVRRAGEAARRRYQDRYTSSRFAERWSARVFPGI